MEQSEVNNPYDKIKQEALYLAFEHGYNSPTKEDNVYADLPEMSKESTAWLKGFGANKKRAKVVKPSPLVTLNGQEVPTDTEGNLILQDVVSSKEYNKSLSELEDHVLITELKKRKQPELESLLKQEQALEDQIYKLRDRIRTLQELMEL